MEMVLSTLPGKETENQRESSCRVSFHLEAL
jgi:hypothetical protein